jgi:ketosteroid isomerase-like protein
MQRSQDNFQVVQGFFTSLEQRDRDAALASFDEHATWDTPAGGPFAGRFFGRAGIGRFLQLLALAHPDGHMVTELTLHAQPRGVSAGLQQDQRRARVRSRAHRRLTLASHRSPHRVRP